MESIFIPISVTYIDHDAFLNCPNLTIYCEASSQPETWHDNWNSDNLLVICNVSNGN